MRFFRAAIAKEKITENEFGELLFDLSADGGWEEKDAFVLSFEETKLANFQSKLLSLSAKIDPIVDEDWKENWKKFLKPEQILDKIWVVPFGMEKPNMAEKIIWIEPGMAFGTGGHESTRIAMKLILETDLRNRSVLDIGAGSGILSICAKMFGAKSVFSVDIDPEVMENFERNCQLNDVTDCQLEIKDMTKPFETSADLIISNVLFSINRKILQQLVKSGFSGQIVISGMIEQEKEIVQSELEKLEMSMIKIKRENEWFGVIAEKG